VDSSVAALLLKRQVCLNFSFCPLQKS
jgi:hypothetical protein